MITPQEYKQSQRELKIINNKERMQETRFKNIQRKVEKKYYRLIGNLKDKQRKEIHKIDIEEADFEDKIKKEKEPHHKNYSEFKRIIKLIETKENKKDTNLNIEVYNWDYPRDEKGEVIRTKDRDYPEKEKIFKKPIAILKDNEFCKIAVYIYGNSKPKNKFSLCVVGRSIFDSEKILDFGWGYLSDIQENGHFKRGLKDLPTINDLMIWWNKNQSKVFNKQINKIEETIKEYLEVIKKTDTKVWEIAYLEDKKDYYENHYSNGTETQEYFDIISKLIEITTGKQKQKYAKIIKKVVVENLK